MGTDWIVKSTSGAANSLMRGGLRPGEVQTLYARSGSGIQALVATMINDAQAKGLRSVCFDMSGNFSYDIVHENALDIDNSLSLLRKKTGYSIDTTVAFIVAHAQSFDADFVIVDMTSPNRMRPFSRVTAQANKIGLYADTITSAASLRNWAVLILLPASSTHWRSNHELSAFASPGGDLYLSRGSRMATIPVLCKKGIPYTVDVCSELAERASSSRFVAPVASATYMFTAALPAEVLEMAPRGSWHRFELSSYLKTSPEFRQALAKLLDDDSEAAFEHALRSINPFPLTDKGLAAAKRVITFDGEAGSFEGVDGSCVEAAVSVWARTLSTIGISVDFEHCSVESMQEIGHAFGLESATMAALAGVPVDDIVV